MNDRQGKIYRILSKQGNASIEQLKREVFASEATLRRDLTQMEQEGLLIRTWGGAVLAGKADSDPPLFVRSNANVRAKNSIAKAAVPGVGRLYLNSINAQDYDFFMMLSSFYLLVGLAAGLVIDLSYGIIDPRIRMGAK